MSNTLKNYFITYQAVKKGLFGGKYSPVVIYFKGESLYKCLKKCSLDLSCIVSVRTDYGIVPDSYLKKTINRAIKWKLDNSLCLTCQEAHLYRQT